MCRLRKPLEWGVQAAMSDWRRDPNREDDSPDPGTGFEHPGQYRNLEAGAPPAQMRVSGYKGRHGFFGLHHPILLTEPRWAAMNYLLTGDTLFDTQSIRVILESNTTTIFGTWNQ